MSTNVTYNISEVTGKLSTKIANLEVQLAHAESARDAYAEKLKELQAEQENAE